MNGKIPITLLDSFIKTVEKIGVDKIQTILDQSSKYNSNTIDSFIIVQIIQNAVCKEFQITVDKLTKDKSPNGLRGEATSIFTFLLHNILNYTWRNIIDNNIMIMGRGTFSEQVKFITNLDIKIKPHKILLEKIDRIKQNISEQLKEQNIIKNT